MSQEVLQIGVTVIHSRESTIEKQQFNNFKENLIQKIREDYNVPTVTEVRTTEDNHIVLEWDVEKQKNSLSILIGTKELENK